MSIFKEFSTRRGFFQGYLRHISDNNEVNNELIFTESGHFKDDRLPENVVKNDDSMWTSENNVTFGQWIQIELKNTILDISAYGIGHGSDNYPKEFDFSVSFDGKIWKKIHTHEESNDLKGVKGKIYKVKRTTARYFKWTNRGNNGNPETNNAFYISYLDFYGIVYKCNDDFGCSFFPHLQQKTKTTQFFMISQHLLMVVLLYS